MNANKNRAPVRRTGGLLAVAMLVFAFNSATAASQTTQPTTEAGEEKINTRVVARGLLRNGQPKLACELLELVYGRETTKTDVLLMQATCSRELERYDDSIAYYRRLIELEPKAVRPHAELGALYLRLGRAAEARAQFAAASQLQQDADAAQLLGRLVQELAPIGQPAALAQRGKHWQVEVFGGLVHDTNINGGPSTSTIAAVIGGVPLDLTLANDSRPIEETGFTASVNAQYLHPLSNRFALLAQGSLAATNYFGHSDYDNDSMATALALIYRKDKFTASLQPSFRLYRQEDDTDTAAYGTTLRLTQGLTNDVHITGSVGFLHNNVPSDDDRDNSGGLASIGLSKILSRNVEVGGEYLVQRERAHEGIHSRTIHGPIIYALARLADKVTATASYRYSDIKHDDRQAIFASTQQDDQHIASVGVDWDISEWTTKGLRLRGQYTYIDNRSNLDAYRYDRQIVTAGVAMRF